MSLKLLVAAIVADGKVDAGEVQAIRQAAIADGKIDLEEVEALFAINNGVSGHPENDASWTPTFVELVSSNIMADGTIDDEEAAFLVDMMQSDGTIDATEKALLNHLATLTELPPELEALRAA